MTFTFAVVNAALMLSAPVSSQGSTQDVVFKGGVLEGLIMSSAVQPDGTLTRVLRPSAKNASPPPTRDAAVVTGLLTAYENRRPTDYRKFLTKDATNSVCPGIGDQGCFETGSFKEFPFAELCVSNTPFYLEGDGKIRLEWICEGKFFYVSWLSMHDGKIAAVSTRPAKPPQLLTVD